MDLINLFETQKLLDEHIEKEHPRVPDEDRLSKKILSLQVELGELANELPEIFKFWSNKKNNFEKALKEYVDGLHFILSIGIELDPKQIPIYDDIEPLKDEFKTVLEAFRHTFNWTVNLDYILFEEPFRSDYRIEKTYFNLLLVFLTLGEMLGFTWEQIEQAYYAKNAVNHERQNNGY